MLQCTIYTLESARHNLVISLALHRGTPQSSVEPRDHPSDERNKMPGLITQPQVYMEQGGPYFLTNCKVLKC